MCNSHALGSTVYQLLDIPRRLTLYRTESRLGVRVLVLPVTDGIGHATSHYGMSRIYTKRQVFLISHLRTFLPMRILELFHEPN